MAQIASQSFGFATAQQRSGPLGYAVVSSRNSRGFGLAVASPRSGPLGTAVASPRRVEFAGKPWICTGSYVCNTQEKIDFLVKEYALRWDVPLSEDQKQAVLAQDWWKKDTLLKWINEHPPSDAQKAGQVKAAQGATQAGGGQQTSGAVGQQYSFTPTEPESATPEWVMPVAIGGGVLVLGGVLLFALRRKRKGRK